MRLFYFFKINYNGLIHKKFNIFDFYHEKAEFVFIVHVFFFYFVLSPDMMQ